MKPAPIIGIAIVLIAVLGFVMGALFPETSEGCTERGCPCEGISGERPCNICFFSDPIFITGILNVVQQCEAPELKVCENGVQIGSRVDLANKKCRTDFYLSLIHI